MVNKKPFTYSDKETLENELILNYKQNKLRVLALGYKDVKKEDYDRMQNEDQKDLDFIEKQFILLCLIVLEDPIRGREVNNAVSDCK